MKKKTTLYLTGAGDAGCRKLIICGKKVKVSFQTTGDGGYRVHLSGDPSTFQPEATYTLRYYLLFISKRYSNVSKRYIHTSKRYSHV